MSRSNHIQLIVQIGVFRSFSVNSIVYRMIRKTIEEIENSNNRFNINHWAGTVRRQQESLHNEKKISNIWKYVFLLWIRKRFNSWIQFSSNYFPTRSHQNEEGAFFQYSKSTKTSRFGWLQMKKFSPNSLKRLQ